MSTAEAAAENAELEEARDRVDDAKPEHVDKAPREPEGDVDDIPADPFLRKLHFELRKDQDSRKWNWVLWAPNHRALATNARPYTRRNDAERAVRRMMTGAGKARVVVSTK